MLSIPIPAYPVLSGELFAVGRRHLVTLWVLGDSDIWCCLVRLKSDLLYRNSLLYNGYLDHEMMIDEDNNIYILLSPHDYSTVLGSFPCSRPSLALPHVPMALLP